MSLRRHIASFSLLVAGIVMLGHVFVPHHHCAEDFSVCFPQLGIHHHADGDHAETRDTEHDGCNMAHSVPSLLFTLRENDTSTQQLFDSYYQHLLFRDNGTGLELWREDISIVNLRVPPELWRDSLWGPDATAGRAPPTVTV